MLILQDVEEEEEPAEGEGEVSRVRSSTVKRLVKRRHKVPDADTQAAREVSFLELLALNKPDWYLVVLGVILSAVVGVLFPLMAVLFSEVLRVSQFTSPYSSPPSPCLHHSPPSLPPDIWTGRQGSDREGNSSSCWRICWSGHLFRNHLLLSCMCVVIVEGV